MWSDRWVEVDEYVSGLLAPEDELLKAALKAGVDGGLPEIQVSPPQARLLEILARSIGARTMLEFGTLAGYSTIWLARALPEGGRLITLEADPEYAEVARENIARAGLADRVDLRLGPALDTLPVLEAESAGPFDLIFIDADKIHTPDYFAWSLERTGPGGLIVADNVIRDGALVDPETEDPTIPAQRRLHELIAADPRVTATTIQTVGAKGYDGFTLAFVAGASSGHSSAGFWRWTT
jgi:predicted O-methyltransferase YrrM